MTAGSAESALELIDQTEPGVALVDIVLPGMNGLQLLARLKERYPDLEVVMMTSHASVETAVNAIRHGALDYLQKPFQDLDEVCMTVGRAAEQRRLRVSNRELLLEQEVRTRELSGVVARLSSLIDAGKTMGECLSLEELLEYFIKVVVHELDVERASLMLVDDEESALRIAACRGIDEIDISNVRVPLGEGIAGSVASTGDALLVTDTKTDPRIEREAKSDLSSSFISAPIVLSIPIKTRKKVLGVINVTNQRSGQAFGEDDLAYLSGLAGQLAVAVERAGQYEELKRVYDAARAAQDQLVFTERLKAVGQMAAGVAHDFNNALSVILARTQFTLRDLGNPDVNLENVQMNLKTIKKIALQGAETIKRIQDYTRIRRDLPDEAADLNAVVRDAVEITRPKWKGECESVGKKIEIEFNLDQLPAVSGNVHELGQVVGNLIFNAVEAMPSGGRLSFRTYQEDGWVRLEVSDTGVGMSQDTQERLFEPFFTTKSDGHGLGTSIIYGIVARHGGEISFCSSLGEGTTFRLQLPASTGEIFAAERMESASAETRSVSILVVEDDSMVRETYEEALGTVGHEVVTCPSADVALEVFDKDRFDVVLTDLSMAGMTGLELAREIKKVSPETPVILISGWAVQQDEERIRESGVDLVLAKPCLIEDLLGAIDRAVRSVSTSVPA